MRPSRLFPLAARVACLVLFAMPAVRGGAADARASSPVTLTDHGDSVTLSNGVISFDVAKQSGNIANVRYRDRSILSQPGYLDAVADGKIHLSHGTFAIVTPPNSTGGELAEVSITQAYAGSGAAFDLELHFVLRRDESAIRVFAVYQHRKEYPAATMAQSRWVLRVNDALFETIAIDEERRNVMPPSDTPVRALGPKESLMFTEGPFKGQITDKYQHFVDAGEHFFHGWMGRESRLGAWIVYGSNEDQNGGPTKQHNAAHFERILLKILTCSHYGAAPVTVAAGEEWRKVYGPWMLYLNEGTPDELWADVQRQAKAERDAWPAPWLHHPAFAPEAQRGRATGRLVVRDPADLTVSAAHAWVGLAEPSPDWQQQSKNYQYWTRADADGQFEIPHVRSGRYTLYAFVDGALGEFRRDDVTIAATASADLGTLSWTPERHGRQLWQIGKPDRTAREFRHGDDFRHWGLWLKYPEEFPHDVDYVIGRSHERTDWNYAQVNVQRNGGWVGTTWRVRFVMPAAPSGGTATLRVALAGAHRAVLNIAVNGRRVAQLKPDLDNAMVRAGIHGQYELDAVTFNASLLRAGENVITFEQARGGNNLFNVMYDALRLELDEATPYRAQPVKQSRRATPVADEEAD